MSNLSPIIKNILFFLAELSFLIFFSLGAAVIIFYPANFFVIADINFPQTISLASLISALLTLTIWYFYMTKMVRKSTRLAPVDKIVFVIYFLLFLVFIYLIFTSPGPLS